MQALVCNIRADGFSDDHQKCVMFSGIFTQSIILFVNGKRIYEALQDCRPDRKKLMLLYLEQLQKEAAPTEHILVAID
ncbi:hypothetical protein, partial [Microcoleus sp. PH2017_18_LLB_O_A]|uniref:hypothetical protein n=1 Tax=Microcoleus sp. PH2017_18_LLB_O_A TaxID=2798829 RepID=UPI00344D430C